MTPGAAGSIANPAAIDATVQPGGRFPTVGKLIDHIFLVERRHLQRLHGQPLSDADRAHRQQRAAALRLRRVGPARARAVLRELGDDEADEIRNIEVRDRQWPMTPAQAALPHPLPRDPPLGADRARGPARRLRAGRRSRPFLQRRAEMTERVEAAAPPRPPPWSRWPTFARPPNGSGRSSAPPRSSTCPRQPAGRSSSSARACSRAAPSRFAAPTTWSPGSRPSSARAASITYSSGNHGQAMALAARELGAPAVVVMPTTAPAIKVEGARSLRRRGDLRRHDVRRTVASAPRPKPRHAA